MGKFRKFWEVRGDWNKYSFILNTVKDLAKYVILMWLLPSSMVFLTFVTILLSLAPF